MDIKNLLPLGTVLMLEGSGKKVMIIGICPQSANQDGEKVVNDYIGVMYPEGYLSADLFMVFNQSDVGEVIREGYRGDGEWQEFLEAVNRAVSRQKAECMEKKTE